MVESMNECLCYCAGHSKELRPCLQGAVVLVEERHTQTFTIVCPIAEDSLKTLRRHIPGQSAGGADQGRVLTVADMGRLSVEGEREVATGGIKK